LQLLEAEKSYTTEVSSKDYWCCTPLINFCKSISNCLRDRKIKKLEKYYSTREKKIEDPIGCFITFKDLRSIEKCYKHFVEFNAYGNKN
jgi:hypothetical protein